MINKITSTLLLCIGIFTYSANAQMRLIAHVHTEYDGAKFVTKDSAYHFHSGTKGQSAGKYYMPEFELMQDSSWTYEDNGGTLTPKFRTVHSYNGTDVQEIIRYEWDGNEWDNDLKTVVQYKNNKPDTVKYQSWRSQGGGSWYTASYYVYTWSGNNVATVARRYYRFQGGGSWRWDWQKTYMWSGGKMTDSVHADWSTGSSQFVNVRRKAFTYTGGRKTKEQDYSWSGGSWNEQTRRDFFYDGQARLDSVIEDINASGWVKNTKWTYKYDATDPNPDSLIRTVWDQVSGFWVNRERMWLDHDGADNLTKSYAESWDGKTPGDWVVTFNDSNKRWYWGFPQSISEENATKEYIKVYPTPATDVINIAINTVKTGAAVQFAITDMSGRIVKEWKTTAKSVVTVSVADLPAGNYLMSMGYGRDISTKKFVITR